MAFLLPAGLVELQVAVKSRIGLPPVTPGEKETVACAFPALALVSTGAPGGTGKPMPFIHTSPPLIVASVFNTSFVAREPAKVGAKLKFRLQLVLAGSEAGQLCVTTKSAKDEPMEVTLTGVGPAVSVSTIAAVLLPTLVLLK